MNLRTKKELAMRTLNVGKERINFVKARIEEIKEAITKEDIRGLVQNGAIVIKPVKGRKTNVKRKNRRGTGKVKKKVNVRKQEYMIMTRKLRKYVADLKSKGLLNRDEILEIRKRIRNKAFKSKANLKLYVEGLRK